MLILARKANQSILIQDNITVTVLAIEGDRVKLGIAAPREVSILRQELCEEVRQENLEAVTREKELSTLLPSLGKLFSRKSEGNSDR